MMKSTLASIVFLSACGTIGVLSCAPSINIQVPKKKYNTDCAFAQRLRQICDGNPNNDYYTKEELEAIAKTSKNETRNGIDIKCAPGSSVYSPLRGRITHLDENTITMHGLRTFNDFTIKMTNVQVSSSLAVNNIVFARQYIGRMPFPHLEGNQEVKVICIHLEMFSQFYNVTHPSWFVCPAVPWTDKSKVFFTRVHGGRPIRVDHDKYKEEDVKKSNLTEVSGDGEDDDEDSSSGSSEPT